VGGGVIGSNAEGGGYPRTGVRGKEALGLKQAGSNQLAGGSIRRPALIKLQGLMANRVVT